MAVEQTEKSIKLEQAYNSNSHNVVDYLRISSQFFDDKETRTRIKRI
jgi:hypothetical protein